MALIVISVDRDNLPEHTEKQYEEWIKFCIGEIGGISVKNPLSDIDMDAEVMGIG